LKVETGSLKCWQTNSQHGAIIQKWKHHPYKIYVTDL